MDFGKYIHELLLENEIVILPGFGAFVSEYKPAEISEDNGEIKPPSKIVSFNPQLRNNDGLLVGIVAEQKRISHFEALKRIEKERENILYRLDIGEQVDLEKVGSLYYNDKHNIEFEAEQDENLLLDSFGLETTNISVSKVIREEKNIETPIVELEKKEEKENKIVVAPETIEKPVSEPIYELQKEEPKEEKKKKGWWWLLFIFIPLIAVSIFILIKGGKNEVPVIQNDKQSTISIIEKPLIVPKDTLTNDSVAIAKDDSLKPEITIPEPIVASNPAVPKYYLVGGSFSIEENAETYLQELKAKGFEAFHVGKKGRFFIVGIGTYTTFNEAETAKREYMTNNPGSEVWVWKN